MIYARQSTAIIVTVGPVLDADGVAVTDAVVGDLKVSKNGGAPAALNGSATLTHRNTGHYSLSLTATDVNTVGTLEIVIDAATDACPVKEVTVVEPAVYDALFADAAAGYQVPIWSSAGATVNLSATTVATVTTTTTATNVTTVNGLAANVITAAATAADFGTEVATAVWASGTRTLTSLAGLTVDAVTTLTNLPTIPANWLTAAGTAADFGTEVGAAVLSALGTGSALTSLAPAATALSTATWTSARAGYLDNVNNATLAGASFPTDPADQSLVIAATDALATLIGDVPTNAELATALAAADDAVLAAIAALSIPTANQNADALLDRAAGVETNRTLRQALRLILAAVAGKVSGAATTTTTIRDTNDSVDRIVATVDADGNRSAVTLNAG